jgi:hypothetical protein
MKGTTNNNTLFITIAIAIVIGVGGFFAGMKYQQTKQPSFTRNGANTFMMGGAQNGQGAINGQTRTGGARMGGGQVMGDILSQDATSITVKLQDGSSKIVLFNDKTTINKAEAASTADLKTGEKVAVFGQTNTDGSVTATNIQLNPILRGQATGSGTPR